MLEFIKKNKIDVLFVLLLCVILNYSFEFLIKYSYPNGSSEARELAKRYVEENFETPMRFIVTAIDAEPVYVVHFCHEDNPKIEFKVFVNPRLKYEEIYTDYIKVFSEYEYEKEMRPIAEEIFGEVYSIKINLSFEEDYMEQDFNSLDAKTVRAETDLAVLNITMSKTYTEQKIVAQAGNINSMWMYLIENSEKPTLNVFFYSKNINPWVIKLQYKDDVEYNLEYIETIIIEEIENIGQKES